MSGLFGGIGKRIGGYFLAGLLAVLPLVITIAIIAWVADMITGIIGPETVVGKQLELFGGRFVNNRVVAYLLGCVLVIAVIFIIGVLVQIGFKRLITGLIDPIIHRIPLAGNLYRTASQLVGMMEKKEDDAVKSMCVVYCNFGSTTGCGLVALMPTSDIYHFRGRQYHMIYIPTSPLPMTGGLIMVPVEEVQQLDAVSVDGLMSIYLSMGVTGPEFLKKLGQPVIPPQPEIGKEEEKPEDGN